MVGKNHFDGRTMHIDMSTRFNQKGDSGVAFKIIPSNNHKGMVLSDKLKKELKKDFKINYAQLYSICIYYLIQDELDSFDNLVICNDEDYTEVKKYLDVFFSKNKEYDSKLITSLSKLRKISGNSKIRSYAEHIANIYRKKALKPLRRQQKGIILKTVKINYQKIKNKVSECEFS